MGEKGNIDSAAAAAAVGLGSGSETVIERTTKTATSTITGVGHDLADTIREKAIEAAADNSIEVARERSTATNVPLLSAAGLSRGRACRAGSQTESRYIAPHPSHRR